MTIPTETPACAAYPRGAILTCVACQHSRTAVHAEIETYRKTAQWPKHCGLQMVARRLRER